MTDKVIPHEHEPLSWEYLLVQPPWKCIHCGINIIGGYGDCSQTEWIGFFPE